MALASTSGKVGTVAAQVVSAIASVELPNGQCMDVVGILLGFVSDPANVNLRVATLQAIGFICESLQSVRSTFASAMELHLDFNAETRHPLYAFK